MKKSVYIYRSYRNIKPGYHFLDHSVYQPQRPIRGPVSNFLIVGYSRIQRLTRDISDRSTVYQGRQLICSSRTDQSNLPSVASRPHHTTSSLPVRPCHIQPSTDRNQSQIDSNGKKELSREAAEKLIACNVTSRSAKTNPL